MDMPILFGGWFINMLKMELIFYRLCSRERGRIVGCTHMFMNVNILQSMERAEIIPRVKQ